jgi:hypothetical protein
MKTDDLINLLAKGDVARPPMRSARMRLAIALAAGLGLGVIGLGATLGMRADIGVQLPIVLAKAAFAAMFAVAGVAAMLRLLRPGAAFHGRALAGAGLVAAMVALGLLTLVGEAPENRFHALTRGFFPLCLVLIPAFGAPTAAALAWFARALAPTELTMAGAAIGGAAGGVGAAIYAMYCPIDAVAFVAVWYALAIAFSAALGAVIVARFLRW